MEKLSRRSFIEKSALVGGGLVVSFYIPKGMPKAFAAESAQSPPPVFPNAYIQIAPDDSITMVINKLEMGQGVNTSIAQIIAEELDCDWTKIKSVSILAVDKVYNSTIMPMIFTGGSTALNSVWDQHRRIGASMRDMLLSTAAEKWGVPKSELRTADGMVSHAKHGKISYGALSEAAAKLPVPEKVQLKDPKDFKIIGKSQIRKDALEKSTGKAVFGIDVRIPGMSYAVIARPPLAGAKIKNMDEKAARAVPGVLDVVKFQDSVAVLGRNTHAAKTGRDALKCEWVNSANGTLSTAGLMKDFKAKGKGVSAKDTGKVDEAMAKAKNTVTAEYEFPFLAHATMEPQNCTIRYDGKTCEMWAGHQMPTLDLAAACLILGLKPEHVKIHQTYAGGSFGRRGTAVCDYVTEACHLAKVLKKPIKIVYTREDDTRAGYFRPLVYHKVSVGLGAKKEVLAWDHKVVGQSIMAGTPFAAMMIKNGLESALTEGVSDTPYDLAQFRCDQVLMTTPVTSSFWRSVGNTHTGYVMETMIDELAEATGKDPLALRKELLKKSTRHMSVLNLLEKETGWGKKKPPKGRAWGLAIHESFQSVVGQVAEVSMVDGMPKIHKIWAAVDCGTVVNPEGARTQVEGAIVYGLSAAMYQGIDIVDGQIQQGNFDSYKVLRIQDMPQVIVSFVKSAAPPTGLGEPGVPPAAPAVANAVHKLIKKRIRVLPFEKALKGTIS